jgi:hypothetical protein
MKLKQLLFLIFASIFYVGNLYSADLPEPDAPNAGPPPPPPVPIDGWIYVFILIAIMYGFYVVLSKINSKQI